MIPPPFGTRSFIATVVAEGDHDLNETAYRYLDDRI